MGQIETFGAPERKFHRPAAGITVRDGAVIEGYASLFGRRDQGGTWCRRAPMRAA